MSSKKVTASVWNIAAIFILLFFNLTLAGRPILPSSSSAIPEKTQLGVLEAKRANLEESCGGIKEEECLMRRTLEAHLDYIYTQKQNP